MPSDKTVDLKEDHKAGSRLKWIGTRIYSDIGELHGNLNSLERKMLVDQLGTSLGRYEKAALSSIKVRNQIYRIYNALVKIKAATSQMSSKFNMSVKGHNDEVRTQVDEALRLAFKMDRRGLDEQAAWTLRHVYLSHKVLFSPEVVRLVKEEGGVGAQEIMRIEQYREKLFRSTLKMVAAIAKRHSHHLQGTSVEWADLVQEGIIAAIAAVEAYHPGEDGKTFTSYVHTWVNGIISKKVNETTRTVAIPRTTLDRFVFVQKAIDDLGLHLEDLRGGPWRDGKIGIGQVSDETLELIAAHATELHSGNYIFSADEVQELIIITQDEISMDIELEHEGDSDVITFGESIPAEAPPADEAIDGALVGQRLMGLVRSYTTDEEYLIMELRYGMGTVKGYRAVADDYTNGTGKPMNKGKVALLDKQVLSRLQRECSLDPGLMKQFREIMNTTVFMAKS